MAIDESFAKEHIDKWIRAWNNHDINAIISLYSDNIEFKSPKINAVYPNKTDAIIYNKSELKDYFSLGLQKFSKLHFVPIDFIIKGNTILLEYYSTPDNMTRWSVVEKFELKDGLILKSSVFYGVEDTV
jgi:hypothetical protein